MRARILMMAVAMAAMQAEAMGATAPKEEGLDPELCPPVRIEAAGKAIDTVVGHAAPFVADIDGSGKPALLVGQFGGGEMRIYRNKGTGGETAGAPVLAEGEVFKAGADTGRVPTG